MYTNRSTSQQALKEAITQAVVAITMEITRRVLNNFRERLHECVNNVGHHLTDVIFKTNQTFYLVQNDIQYVIKKILYNFFVYL